MGSDLSVLVGEFLDYEEYPSVLKKLIIKKYAKAVRGREKEVIAKLQTGDPNDKGRNESLILRELKPAVQKEAYRYLYSPWLEASSLCQYLITHCGPSLFDAFITQLLTSITRQRCGVNSIVLDDSMSWIGMIFIRHGQLILRKKEEALASLERGSYLEISIVHQNIVRVPKMQFKKKNIALVSLTPCDFSLLDITTFKSIIKRFPIISEQYDKFLKIEEENYQAELEAERNAQLEAERMKLMEKKKALQLDFIQAASDGDMQIMQQCIEEGAEINAQIGPNGETPLYASCKNCNEAAVKFLLVEKGALVNMPCHDGQTPLHIACQRGWQEGIRMLFESGADFNACDVAGETPVHMAALCGKVDVLEGMMSLATDRGMKLNINQPAVDGRTPLDVCRTIHARRVLKPKSTLGYNIAR